MGLETPTYIDDLVTTNPLSSDPRSEGDDHIRNLKTAIKNTFPGFAGRFNRRQTKSSGYTPVLNDSHSVIECTATLTLSMTAAATLGSGWSCIVLANGGDVTVDPNGAETVNGQTTVMIPNGQAALVLCDAADFSVLYMNLTGGVLSPSQITANQNDYNPTGAAGADVWRINSDARRNLTGIAGGTNGRRITLINTGTFPILIKDEDSGSTAANRFAFGWTLGGGKTMVIWYDGTSSRWRCVYKELPPGTELEFHGTTVPEGTLPLDGSNRSRTTYASLFNEIGTTWGTGDGSTTFGTADTRRKTAVGVGGSGTGTLGNAVGNSGGAETHTLTSGEMPVHAHSYGVDGTALAGSPFTGGAENGDTFSDSTNNAGSGNAHNNMQPSYVVTKCIVY